MGKSFLACRHCNHIKGNKFTPILDCTKIEFDEIISFRKIGYFGTEETIEIKKVDDNDDITIQMTCDLLQRIYYGNTPQEKSIPRSLIHAGNSIVRNASAPNASSDVIIKQTENLLDHIKFSFDLTSSSNFADFFKKSSNKTSTP